MFEYFDVDSSCLSPRDIYSAEKRELINFRFSRIALGQTYHRKDPFDLIATADLIKL